MIYIFWTCRDAKEAKSIIHSLLDKKWIACASLLPPITSIYRWEGKVEEATEVKVILKTKAAHFEAICALIHKEGSYEVPEIAALKAEKVDPFYASWLTKETV